MNLFKKRQLSNSTRSMNRSTCENKIKSSAASSIVNPYVLCFLLFICLQPQIKLWGAGKPVVISEVIADDEKKTVAKELTLETYPIYAGCRFERPASFFVGEEVIMFCKAKGMKTTKDNAMPFCVDVMVQNPQGDITYLEKSKEMRIFDRFGSSSVAFEFSVDFGEGAEPGTYLVRSSVTDRTSDETATASYPIIILPKDAFGVRNFALYADEDHTVKLGESVTEGATIYFHGKLTKTGLRDGKTDITMIRSVTDEKGTQISSREEAFKVSVAKNGCETLTFPERVNRPGRFNYRLTVKDNISNKTSTIEIPLKVFPLLEADDAPEEAPQPTSQPRYGRESRDSE